MPEHTSSAFKHGTALFCAVFVVVLIGFVPSFFPEWSGREVSFTLYHHVHGLVMLLWLGLLILQPTLIQQQRLDLHRTLGRYSPVLLAAVVMSVLVLAHSQLETDSERIGAQLYIPLKDLFVITTLYCMAIYYRKSPAIHSRLMAGTAFQLLEPALFRAFSLALPQPAVYLATELVISATIIAFIIMDRRLERGKWVFWFVLFLTWSIHGFLLSGGPRSDWFVAFTLWFASLPLT